MMQQPEVRRAVYEGMPALLAADPSVQVCAGRGKGAGQRVLCASCSGQGSNGLAAGGWLEQSPQHAQTCYCCVHNCTASCPQDSVVEPLLPHFLQFYEADENLSPPLKLEACARIQVGRPRACCGDGPCRQQAEANGCKAIG